MRWIVLIACTWCLAGPTASADENEATWALAIHGGAGTIPQDMPRDVVEGYYASLRHALSLGADLLSEGRDGLETVVAVIAVLEDDPRFNAGKGAVFTHQGSHELDAAIMDGRTLNCGAIAGVKTVKNPIKLARLVMEASRHVFLSGEGAEAFALDFPLERVDQKYFFTERRYNQWQKALEKDSFGVSSDDKKGTVGCVVRDQDGNLFAGTSTGGLTNKRFGRIGDVPIIGAGTYAKNATCAVSCTGFGEQFIRHTVAHDVSAMMEYGKLSLKEAASTVIQERLDPGDGGLIAVSAQGEVVLEFNSAGMFRGSADSKGRFEVGIWESTKK